jgi:hypothetical protein
MSMGRPLRDLNMTQAERDFRGHAGQNPREVWRRGREFSCNALAICRTTLQHGLVPANKPYASSLSAFASSDFRG